MGDLFLTALANVLKMVIVVITSAINMPYIQVHPREGNVSHKPVIVAYDQSGPGHYDALVWCQERVDIDKEQSRHGEEGEDLFEKKKNLMGV